MISNFSQTSEAQIPVVETVSPAYLAQVAKSKKTYHQVKKATHVVDVLRKHGFKPSERRKISKQPVIPYKYTLKGGQRYRLSKTADGKFIEVRLFDLRSNAAFVMWKRGKDVGIFATPMVFTTRIRRIKGKVRGSIYGTLADANIHGEWIAMRVIDAYSLKHNLMKELQRGARYEFSIEEKFDGKNFLGYGELLEAHLELRKKMVSRYFVPFREGPFVRSGAFISSDLNGDRPLYSPVAYQRISSPFKKRRFHPIRRRRVAHLGMDFELAQGEPVYAAKKGVIARMGKNRAAGNYIVIRHGKKLETSYNHLSKISPNIKPGRKVKDGQILGQIGCTGYCTKPHLHFSVRKNGRYLDPAKFIKSYPYSSRAQAQARREDIKPDATRFPGSVE